MQLFRHRFAVISRKYCLNARFGKMTFIGSNKTVAGGKIPAIESLELETGLEPQEIHTAENPTNRQFQIGRSRSGFLIIAVAAESLRNYSLIVWDADMAPSAIQWQINWILHRVSPSRINPTRLRESQTEASQPENLLNWLNCQEVSAGFVTSRQGLNYRIIQEPESRNSVQALN